jgi:hypothetical protein
MMNCRLLAHVCFVFVLFISNNLFAAECTHYVSNSGSGATCSIGSPCAVQYAFDNAAAGDVWCFRGGTYHVPAKTTGDGYAGYYNVANNGTAEKPIVFQAYPGEIPIMNGTKEGGVKFQGGWNGPIGETIFGVLQKNYITFDGFTFQSDGGATMARMFIGCQGCVDRPGPYNTTNIVIRNCTFNGGATLTADDGYDNAEGLRLEGVEASVVSGNTFYNYKYYDDSTNISATKSYRVNYITYENNKINNCSTGIFDKSAGDHNIFRYNWIYNVNRAIEIATNVYYQTNGSIYNNLIVNAVATPIRIITEAEASVANWNIYNNTIYNSGAVSGNCVIMSTQAGVLFPENYSFYNNIIECAGMDYLGASIRTNMNDSNGLVTLDYNNYGSSMAVRLATGVGVDRTGTNYTTISGLQAVAAYNLAIGSHDMHSIAAAPTFVNTSGILNSVTDFALAVGSAGKNAGSDGNDMGADISKVGPTACSSLPVRINNTEPGYSSISAAYAAAATDQTINMRDITFSETLTFSHDINVKLAGGHNCSFSSSSGYSTIAGKVTIGGVGKVTMDRLILR